MLAMGYEFHAACTLSEHVPWHEKSFSETVRKLIDGSTPGALLVAKINDALMGMAAFVLSPMYFNINVKVAQEVFWWAAPQHRFGIGSQILGELERRARDMGAALIILTSIVGMWDEALNRIYVKQGYRLLENTYVKDI